MKNIDNMQSACEALLYRTYQESWKRGEKYADDSRVKIISLKERSIKAKVKGTHDYEVTLAFKGGGISRKCECPVNDFCKHMAAAAIVWDEMRGITRPSKEEINDVSVPPPLVSRADIDRLYKDPINSDLQILRMASSGTGRWFRPHAVLPLAPKINTDKKSPIDLDELKKSFSEIRSWTRRRNYDYYFCAGEMAAAFIEVLRNTIGRISASDLATAADALLLCQRFNDELIAELIDDSEGQWMLTEPHLELMYEKLKESDREGLVKDKLEQYLKRKI